MTSVRVHRELACTMRPSVLTFNKVEYKNLDATTGSVGKLMKEASTYLGVSQDLHVCAVDDDGVQTPINGTTDVWLDDDFEGTILGLRKKTMTRVSLRFNWGAMENGVWTPKPLPW